MLVLVQITIVQYYLIGVKRIGNCTSSLNRYQVSVEAGSRNSRWYERHKRIFYIIC
jgi:hypothetical protein